MMKNLDKVIKVLIVDDDFGFCSSLADVLDAMGYNVLAETDAREVLGILSHAQFDVVLVDLAMAPLGGLELIRLIREAHPNLPIIVVSANRTASDTAMAKRCGASEFLDKPVDFQFLEMHLLRACKVEEARRLANTDPLTGLFNRRYFLERLDEEVKRARHYKRPLSLVMADIDHFEAINDTLDHARGDQVLITISQALGMLSRNTDVLARFGGDELVFLLPETSMPYAFRLAERARGAVAASEWNEELFASGEHASISMSFGVATFSSDSSREELILAANDALDQAKREGCNRVCRAEGPSQRDLGLGKILVDENSHWDLHIPMKL